MNQALPLLSIQDSGQIMETGITWGERSAMLSKLAPALAKAQGEIGPVKKDSENPFFKSKYADLATIRAATKEALQNNGLSIIQEAGTQNNRAVITTTILHSSGEFIRSSLELPIVKQDPQGVGSALTYARRYALAAMLGIASEDDDDGNAASFAGQKTPPPNSARAKSPSQKPKELIPFADDIPQAWQSSQDAQGAIEYIYDIDNADPDIKTKAMAVLQHAKARLDGKTGYYLSKTQLKKLERFEIGHTEPAENNSTNA